MCEKNRFTDNSTYIVDLELNIYDFSPRLFLILKRRGKTHLSDFSFVKAEDGSIRILGLREEYQKEIFEYLHSFDIYLLDKKTSNEVLFVKNPFNRSLHYSFGVSDEDYCSENCEFFSECQGFDFLCVKETIYSSLKTIRPKYLELIKSIYGIDSEIKTLLAISNEQNASYKDLCNIYENALERLRYSYMRNLVSLFPREYQYHPFGMLLKDVFGSEFFENRKNGKCRITELDTDCPIGVLQLSYKSYENLIDNNYNTLYDLNKLNKQTLLALEKETQFELLSLLDINGYRLSDCSAYQYDTISSYLREINNIETPKNEIEYNEKTENELWKEEEQEIINAAYNSVGFCFITENKYRGYNLIVSVHNNSNKLLKQSDFQITDCYISMQDGDSMYESEFYLNNKVINLSSKILPHSSRKIIDCDIEDLPEELNYGDSLVIAVDGVAYFKYIYNYRGKWQLISFIEDK